MEAPTQSRLNQAYATLGYSSGAMGSQEKLSGVKHAYAHAALKAHPDKGGTTQQFEEVKGAYDLIEHTKKNTDMVVQNAMATKFGKRWLDRSSVSKRPAVSSQLTSDTGEPISPKSTQIGLTAGKATTVHDDTSPKSGVSPKSKGKDEDVTTGYCATKKSIPPSQKNLAEKVARSTADPDGAPVYEDMQAKEQMLKKWLWEERENDLTRRLVFAEQLLSQVIQPDARDHKGEHGKSKKASAGGGLHLLKKDKKDFTTVYSGPYAVPQLPTTTTFYMDKKAAKHVEEHRVTHAQLVAAKRHDRQFVGAAQWLAGVPQGQVQAWGTGAGAMQASGVVYSGPGAMAQAPKTIPKDGRTLGLSGAEHYAGHIDAPPPRFEGNVQGDLEELLYKVT